MLNMSAVNSRLMGSRIGIRLAMRRSLNTVHGVRPALRPRLPSSDSSVPLKAAPQGSWNCPVGENFDDTGTFPEAVHAAFTVVFGLPVSDESCRLSPLPVMMLNGRPELNSISGADVQSLRKALAKPPPPTCPV